MTNDANLVIAAALLGVVGCGRYSVARDARPSVASPDSASAGARDGAGDTRRTETTDAVCSMEGWDAGAAAVAPRDQGILILSKIGNFEGYTSGLFTASFSRAGQPVVPPSLLVGGGHIDMGPGVCNLGNYDPCVVTTTACAIPTSPCAPPQAGKLQHGPPDELGFPDSPNPDGTYVPEDIGGGPSFVPGDMQTVVATGGDLPPFSLQVTAPGCIALLKPAVTPPAPDAAPYPSLYTIARGQDLELAWTGGETGATVGVELISGANDDMVDVSCSFPAAGGQGTIPQQALLALAAFARLTICQETSVTAQVGTFGVEFAVRNLGGEYSALDAGACGVDNGFITFE